LANKAKIKNRFYKVKNIYESVNHVKLGLANGINLSSFRIWE